MVDTARFGAHLHNAMAVDSELQLLDHLTRSGPVVSVNSCGLKIQYFFLPPSDVFLRCLWISEQAAIILPYSIN
jgi:hypothetical protein